MARYVKVSTVCSPPCVVDDDRPSEAVVRQVIEQLSARIRNVLPEKPDIIVLPEACDRPAGFSGKRTADYYRERGDRVLEFFMKTAACHGCYIAYPSARMERDGKLRNSTRIISRRGEIAGTYDKNHLVIEEYTENSIVYGEDAPVITCDFGRVACAICFDLNFDELRMKYAAAKPEMILFSSNYHGGLMQNYWAYSCRAHFVGAISGAPGTVISPVGHIIARTTNYFEFVTATVNLDCCVVHLHENWPRLEAMKRAYGSRVTVFDPGYLGAVLVSSEMADTSIESIVEEFELELLDDFLGRSLAHRHAAGEAEKKV